jgi:hypothetical protein
MLQRHSTASWQRRVAWLVLCAGSSPAFAQTQFEFESLPELAGGESFAHSIMGDVDGHFVIGTAKDENDVRLPVVWDASAGPATIGELPVPVPGFTGVEAKVISQGPSGTQYAGGCAPDSLGVVHSLVWKRESGDPDWIAEELFFIPSSGQYEPYIVPSASGPPGSPETRLDTVGTVYFDGDPYLQSSARYLTPSEATLASKDLGPGGDWTVTALPDTGPTFASRAEVLVYAAGSGSRIIAGAIQTEGAPLVPVIWEETAPAVYTVVELPLAPGATLGALTDLIVDEDGQTLIAVGYNALPGAFDFYRPVVYRRVNGVWGLPRMLPPLPGLRDARPGGVIARASLSLDHLTVVGRSYFEPGPGDQRATMWEIDSDDGVVISDLNDAIDGAPPGAVLTRAEGVQLAGSPRRIMIAGVYTALPGEVATHAFLLTALYPIVPATSLLGSFVLSLGLLVGAMAVLRSRRTGARSRKTAQRFASVRIRS